MDAGRATVARLVALEADVEPAEFDLGGDDCALGRAATCQVVIPRPTISRLHARIAPDGPRYRLHDAGSANGVFVNGQRITGPHLLADRDAIGLGSPLGLLRFVDPDPTLLPANRLRYDERTMRFFLGPRAVDLTPNEFKLLRLLFQRAGSLCTREACAEAIWGADYVPGMDADALDRVVSNLRRKLRSLDPTADLLRTRPGLGYELEP